MKITHIRSFWYLIFTILSVLVMTGLGIYGVITEENKVWFVTALFYSFAGICMSIALIKVLIERIKTRKNHPNDSEGE